MLIRITRIAPVAAIVAASSILFAGCSDSPEASATATADQGSQGAERARSTPTGDASSAAERRERPTADRDAPPRGRERARPERESPQVRIALEPEVLDFGHMDAGETKVGTVNLKNISEEPVRIVDSRTSCGCTVANVPKGEYLSPGESTEVEVSLRGSQRAERLIKTVTFIIEDHPPVTMRVQGEVITYVTMRPTVLNPEVNPDTSVHVTSEDGQPFRITAMHPQISVEPITDEAREEHIFQIDWDRWRELGQARRLLLTLDHPKAAQVIGTIRVPAHQHDHGSRPGDMVQRGRDARTQSSMQAATVIRQGNLDRLTEMLDEGLDVNARVSAGMTLLALAAQRGNTDIVNLLLERGADVNAASQLGRTPLMEAAQSKNAEVARILLNAGAELDAVDNTVGGTALFFAGGFGSPETVEVLLEAGADVELTGSAGLTPLMWAAALGESASVGLLIDAGADVNAADATPQRATVLIHASRTGRTENIERLIAAGADVEKSDSGGRTPLLWATGSSSATVDTIRVLLEAGADINAKDNGGLTALDHAQGRSDENAAAVREFIESRLAD